MAVLLVLVPVTPFERRAFGGLAATLVVGPILLGSPIAGAVAMAAVMTAVLLLLALRTRGTRLSATEGAVGAAVAVAFVAMAGAEVVSFALPGLGANALPYGLASVGVMLAEGWVLVRRGLRSPVVPLGGPLPGSTTGTASSAV